MSDLTAWEKKSKIRKGEPITQAVGNGELTFYPITMKNYEEFLALKSVLALRLSSLPVKYSAMPYFAALWAVDFDSVVTTGKTVGLFERFLRLLYLCLRLGYKAEEALEHIYHDPKDPKNIQFVDIVKDGKLVRLTPLDISFVIRPLIAAQNGVELPDESYNMELVATEEMMNKDNAAKNPIKYDTDTLISSVAYASRINENEIDDWTVLQFERRREAIERDKNYMLYRAAELGGMVKFPSNPFKSWCFDVERLSSALIPLSELQQKHRGIGDIKATVSATDSQAKQEK